MPLRSVILLSSMFLLLLPFLLKQSTEADERDLTIY